MYVDVYKYMILVTPVVKYACNTYIYIYSWYQKLCWESTVSKMKLESSRWAIVVFWCFWQVLTLYVSRKKILMDADRFTTTSSTTSREHATCDSMIGTVWLCSNIMIRHACMQNVLKLDHTASYCVYMGKSNHKTDVMYPYIVADMLKKNTFFFSKAYFVDVFAKVYTDVRPLSCPVTSRTKKLTFSATPHWVSHNHWLKFVPPAIDRMSVCLWFCHGHCDEGAMQVQRKIWTIQQHETKTINIIEPPQIFTPIKQWNIHELHQLSSLQNFPWWRCVRLDLCKPCLRGWARHAIIFWKTCITNTRIHGITNTSTSILIAIESVM